MKVFKILLMSAMVACLGLKTAQAWHTEGCVYCDVNQNQAIDPGDTPFEGVGVLVTNIGSTFSNTRTTKADGCYSMILPDVSDTYFVEMDEASLPEDASLVIPAYNPHSFTLTDQQKDNVQDWLFDSSVCRQQQCWLTAGGVKFSTITGTLLDEYKSNGPVHNWGGNVNPACAPNKGHWNHIAHKDQLHFQATDIEVLQCGNVPGIDPGSESPVTPVNYIEFTGPATLKGIKGNKDDFGEVCYFARAEDRNEPGSNGAKDGIDIDRYFIHVYDCSTLETLMLVDMDGNPDSIDPVMITGGNMQMHWKPCDN